ncbi:hypothetical protein D3C78_1757280 [compost metagenome]
MAVFDQGADEIEIGLRSRGEGGFDFFHTNADQGLPETQLFPCIHWLDQRLVAITQVRTAPDWRLGDGLRWPGTVRQVDGSEGTVFFRRVFEHGHESNP